MELCRRNCFSKSWNQVFKWLMVVILGVCMKGAGGINCPVLAKMLYAYTTGDTYRFEYTFDPVIKTNIGLIDRLLTSDDDVSCDWVVRASSDHTVLAQIEDFNLSPRSGTREGDCLEFYDGQTEEDKLLGKLCGGETPPENYKTSGRYLHIVFTQGEITGRRSFTLFYKAEQKSKELVIKIFGFTLGGLVVIGFVVLVFIFTRKCRPCRKRCCPDEPVEEGTSHRELRPLSPVAIVPPSVNNAREEGMRDEQRDVAFTGGAAESAGHRNQPNPQSQEEAEGHLSLPHEEPPPSYDSIFGSAEDRNKAS